MTADRHLDWDGCLNARDLGGIRTAGGSVTRRGAVVRSDAPDGLTTAGWAALRAYGIRTIVDLRNHEERAARPRVDGLTVVHVPLDDPDDAEFWDHIRAQELGGTPLYYGPFLERKAERCAAAVAAVARAAPGGVLVHCGIGRDRTGLIVMLLLALVGVAPEEIAADYELSYERLLPLLRGPGGTTYRPQEVLASRNTTAREAILATLAAVDLPARLGGAGLTGADLAAVRARMLEPSGPLG